MDPLSRLLDRLERVRTVGEGYTARCPAHDDSDPSLSITEGDRHPILVYCHAGCSPEAIAGAVGMSAQDFCKEEDLDSERIRRKKQKAPRPTVEHPDEEWERRCTLWKQMTGLELEMLELARRGKYRAKEHRNSKQFHDWVDHINWLYDAVAERIATDTHE